MKRPGAKFVRSMLMAMIAVFLVIQAIPYGRNHDNPAIVREPAWDSPKTREIAKRACYDCHSNETVWPWYTWIAPFSWLVYQDVEEGRRELNFSDWQYGAREGEKPDEIREQIDKGEMPPVLYRLMHAEARLTDREKRFLSEGLTGTVMRTLPGTKGNQRD